MRKRIKTLATVLIIFSSFAAGQGLEASDLKLQLQLTNKDLAGGLLFSYADWTNSSINTGISLRAANAGVPVGFVVRGRQAFYIPENPFEAGITAELEIYKPDSSVVFLPSLGADISFRVPVSRDELMLSLGGRFGWSYDRELSEGEYFTVVRRNIFYPVPLFLGLTWVHCNESDN